MEHARFHWAKGTRHKVSSSNNSEMRGSSSRELGLAARAGQDLPIWLRQELPMGLAMFLPYRSDWGMLGFLAPRYSLQLDLTKLSGTTRR
jgi:hypothetical protein